MKENGRRYEKNSQCCSYDYNYYLVTKGEHKPNFQQITMQFQGERRECRTGFPFPSYLTF